jgi:hypothetical protein
MRSRSVHAPLPVSRDLTEPSRFNVGVQIQERLIAALRRCYQALPDRRRRRNTTYAMADFALADFVPFFMQSPSFLVSHVVDFGVDL